jgi:hypothetical protein
MNFSYVRRNVLRLAEQSVKVEPEIRVIARLEQEIPPPRSVLRISSIFRITRKAHSEQPSICRIHLHCAFHCRLVFLDFNCRRQYKQGDSVESSHSDIACRSAPNRLGRDPLWKWLCSPGNHTQHERKASVWQH